MSWHYAYDYSIYVQRGWRRKVVFKGWFRDADSCVEAALRQGAIKEGDLFDIGYNQQLRRAGT